MHYAQLMEKGYTPFKDESYFTNGYLETELDWVKGMKDIRLRDLPSFLRTTNPDEFMLKYVIQETGRAKQASAIILNTFNKLEEEALTALQSMLPPPVYAVGPLQLLQREIEDKTVKSISSSLWKDDDACLGWLDKNQPNSVVYVNFGSITVMSPDQLVEFAWGLTNSKKPFLWILRPDIVAGEAAILPPEILEETKDRGMISSWCPQEKVLNHPAIGGFLTHCGWNSTLESIYSGVPMLCWPFFAEQPTNCWFSCTKLGVGMEIDGNVEKGAVERLVRELMDGEKGKEMKKKAMEWKRLAEDAISTPNGSSCLNLQRLINDHLLSPKRC
ncbi:unnamed protein product [Cuscuta epithymum]|uniref:UDP-glycosyltransferases domain-containing protein n=1 Tax=Cuscuta epithymum TaxID=186058 RepID=A0AAV0EZV8_9ASTE|nr:unnamed protein product [Cuscuta epithymum]